MLLHKQMYRHNPPESFGDCHRTVYACLLGKPLESIPNSGIIGPCDMNDPNFPSYYWVSFLIPAPWAYVVSPFEVIVRPIELI